MKQITLIIFILSVINVKSQQIDTLQNFWTKTDQKKNSIKIITKDSIPNSERNIVIEKIKKQKEFVRNEILKNILQNNKIVYNKFNPFPYYYNCAPENNKAIFYFYGNHIYTYWEHITIQENIEYLISYTYSNWDENKKIFISAFPIKYREFGEIISPFDIIMKYGNIRLRQIKIYYNIEKQKFLYEVVKSTVSRKKVFTYTIDAQTNKVLKKEKGRIKFRAIITPSF